MLCCVELVPAPPPPPPAPSSVATTAAAPTGTVALLAVPHVNVPLLHVGEAVDATTRVAVPVAAPPDRVVQELLE